MSLVEVWFDDGQGDPLRGRWQDGVFTGTDEVVQFALGAAASGAEVDLTPFGPTVKAGADDPLAAIAAIAAFRPGQHQIVAAPMDIIQQIELSAEDVDNPEATF